MGIELILVAILIAVFFIGAKFEINIGLLALVAAFFVGTYALDMSAKDIMKGFPTDLFIMILGISVLMSIANLNGSIDWIVGKLVHYTGGQMVILPWLLFTIGVLVSSFGTAAAPILFMVGLGFAARYQMNPLLLGALALHGSQAGLFSPIAPYGILFQLLSGGESVPPEARFTVDAWAVYGLVVLGHVLLAIVVFFIFGGHKMIGQRISNELIEQTLKDAGGLNPERILTLASLLILLVGSTALHIHIGFLALTLSIVILLVSPNDVKQKFVAQIPWFILLIISGVLVLVGVLQEANLFEWMASKAQLIGSSLAIALLLGFLAGGITAVSSTFATFGILVPLAAPFVISGDVNGTALIAALAVSAAVTDISPFSPWGAMFLGYAHQFDKEVLMRAMLKYAMIMIAIMPIITWLIFVLPTSL